MATLVGMLVMGCGGHSSSSVYTSETFAPTALTEARTRHTSSQVAGGEILVAGGIDSAGEPTAQTLIVTRTSVEDGPVLQTARIGHSATVLPSGKVLIVGGYSDAQRTQPISSTEVYDPATGEITPGPRLLVARGCHAAAAIPGAGDAVIIAGGRTDIGGRADGGASDVIERFEGVALDQATVDTLPALDRARRWHTATAAAPGQVLVIGGFDTNGNALASIEHVNPHYVAPPPPPAPAADPDPTPVVATTTVAVRDCDDLFAGRPPCHPYEDARLLIWLAAPGSRGRSCGSGARR